MRSSTLGSRVGRTFSRVLEAGAGIEDDIAVEGRAEVLMGEAVLGADQHAQRYRRVDGGLKLEEQHPDRASSRRGSERPTRDHRGAAGGLR